MNFIKIDVNSISEPFVHPQIDISPEQHKERKIREEEYTVKTLKQQMEQVFNVTQIEKLTIDDHLQLSRCLLKSLGFNFLDKDYLRTKFVLLGIFSGSHAVHYLVVSYLFIKEHISDVDTVSESLTTSLLAFFLIEKYMHLFICRNDVNELIAKIRYDYYTAMANGGFEKDIMHNKFLEARIVTRCLLYTSILCVMLFIAYPLYRQKDHMLPFPQTLWYASKDTNRNYYINLAFQIYSLFYAVFIFISYDAICIFILLTLCGRVNILQYKIKKFGEDCQFYYASDLIEETKGLTIMKTDCSVKYINHCIEYQQDMYKLANDFNNTFKIDRFTALLFSGLVGCVSLYQLTVKSGAEAIPYYVYMGIDVVQLFIFCFYGNLLNFYSMEIPNALYNTQWYRAPAPVKESIKVMLARSQKPINVSGIFANLTLQSFRGVMRSMYSFYALLVKIE